jgi:YVTN family beta-propeller protein
VGKNPDGVSADPTANKIYVANSGDGTVSVIDGITNTVSETIPAGTHPYGIAVDSSTGVIYAGNDSPGIIYIISDSKTSQDFFENIIQFFLHLFNLK